MSKSKRQGGRPSDNSSRRRILKKEDETTISIMGGSEIHDLETKRGPEWREKNLLEIHGKDT